MATRVYESVVINAPLDRVWSQIRLLDFHFLSTVASCTFEDKAVYNTVGGFRKITYKDKTEQRLHLLEYSESHNYLTYEVVSSTPAVTYSSAINTIQARRVTEDNATFVEFITDFSRDASSDVIADSRYKKHDYFKGLAAVTEDRAALFFRKLDFTNFNIAGEKALKEAWDAFDTDKNGYLDPKELENLVKSFVAKIADEQHTVVAALNRMFDVAASEVSSSSSKEEKKQDKATATTTSTTKSKANKKIAERMNKEIKHLARELQGTLDKNKDGKIEFSEFKVFFPRWFEKKIGFYLSDSVVSFLE